MAQTNTNDPTHRLAIVILNYNGLLHLKNYINSVVAHIPAEGQLYIADNGSTDGSVAFLREYYPEIELILLSENSGYAGGYNKALQKINAEYYFLVNSDVELTELSIVPLLRFMDQHPQFAACQPKINALLEKKHFEYAGASGGWLDRFGYPFCRGRILDTNERDMGQYDDPIHIFWATGAALMIRSSDFHEAGGFDSEFFAHMEEIDLCWRLQRMGRKIAVIPEARIYHLGGGTLKYSSPRKTFLNFRNSLYVLSKNENKTTLIWLLPFRMILDGIAGLRFLLLSDTKNFAAILKAHYHFYKQIPDLIRKRKSFNKILENKNTKNSKGLDGRYNGAIVWDYYIRKKKYFSELKIDEKKQLKIYDHL